MAYAVENAVLDDSPSEPERFNAALHHLRARYCVIGTSHGEGRRLVNGKIRMCGIADYHGCRLG